MLVEKESQLIDLDLYLSKYLVPVVESKRIIFYCVIIGFLFSSTFSLFIKAEYTSQATILVEEPRSAVVSSKVSDDVAPRKAEGAYVLAQAEKLNSDTFLTEVLKILPSQLRLELAQKMSFKAQFNEGLREMLRMIIGTENVRRIKQLFEPETAPGAELMKERALIAELNERVTIRSKANRAMIWITASTFSKDMSPVLVKSYIDVWSALNLEENRAGIRAERIFAEEQKKEAALQLQQAEKKLIEFKRQYQIPTKLKYTPDIGVQLEMEKLQNGLEAAKDRYNRLDQIFTDTSRKESGIVINIKVINSPRTPLQPTRSLSGKLIFAGTVMGLLCGLIVILSLDFLKGTIRHEKDIHEVVHIPIIGNIPKI